MAVGALRITGVSPKQFLDTLQDAFVNSMKNRTGAEEVTIEGVRSTGGGASASARRLQAGGVEVDSSLRFAATADSSAAATAVQAFVSGTSGSGGAGDSLLADL